MKNLIKRKKDNFDFNVRDGWYCEVRKNSKPNGSQSKQNEEIYIAQSGYAIFAKGIILETNLIVKDTLQDFVKYAMNESKVKDADYWFSKIEEYSKGDNFKYIYILEYYIGQVTLFDTAIPLEERFAYQSAWYRIEDEYSFPMPKANSSLTRHIPTKIREEIYHKFKISSSEYIIDIDHFVPASLGGPGNIYENLIPISASINRRKSNRVPSKLFDLAFKHGFSAPSGLKIAHDVFYNTTELLTLAKLVIEKINQQEIEEVRHDYRTIRNFHFPILSTD